MVRERKEAVVCLIAAALCWSSGGVLIKWIHGNPLGIAGVRSAFAAVLLWIVLRRPRFDWSPVQIGGAVAYAATVLLYVPAVKMTSAANAILLQYTAPIYIALFGAWFLGEKATWLDWLSIAVTLGGMALFFRQGLASQSFWGDFLAALSGVTIAWMMLLLRKQKAGSPLESILLGNVLTALVGLPFLVGSPLSSRDWLGLAALGMFQLGLAYALYGLAIKYVTALEAVLIATLEPILNPIWVALLVGEVPGLWTLVGGGLVLIAVTARGALMATKPPTALRQVHAEQNVSEVRTCSGRPSA